MGGAGRDPVKNLLSARAPSGGTTPARGVGDVEEWLAARPLGGRLWGLGRREPICRSPDHGVYRVGQGGVGGWGLKCAKDREFQKTGEDEKNLENTHLKNDSLFF